MRILALTLGWACVLCAPVRSQQALAPRPTSTLVWQGKGVDVGGSASPDGRYVSFTDWETGNLALRDLATEANRTIVATNNARGKLKVFAEASTISRDGHQVAYSWYDESTDRYELRIASLGGSPNPRTAFASESVDWLAPRDWSPDGKWIVAQLFTKDHHDQLALIAAGTGHARVLRAGYWSDSRRAFFSPDGKYLAYDFPADETGAPDVWVAAVDGSSEIRVVGHRATDVVMGWSPDGGQLLFASDRTGSMALFSQAMQDGTPRGAPVPIKPDMGLANSMGVSRTGALVYGTQSNQRGGGIQVARFNPETGAVTSSRDVSTSPLEDNINPTWSPNGQYLAYVSARGRGGSTRVIVVRHADTGGLVREIHLRLEQGEMSGWAPDSKSLLLVGRDLATGQRGSFRADVATGEVAFLFATPPVPPLQMPVWSADGGSLYYVRWNPADRTWSFIARHLASGTERVLVTRPFLGSPLLSPDGRFLTTETADTVASERALLLVPTDGTPARELMRIPSGVTPGDVRRVERGARLAPASWIPAGDTIIARLWHQGEGVSELWRVPVDGGAPRKLPATVDAHVFKFTISPDGRRVAYRIKESEPPFPRQVWKLEHFIPAAR